MTILQILLLLLTNVAVNAAETFVVVVVIRGSDKSLDTLKFNVFFSFFFTGGFSKRLNKKKKAKQKIFKESKALEIEE